MVWKIGNAFPKVTVPHTQGVTRKHVTLNAIHDMQSGGFKYPKVMYHGEWDSRYFLILPEVPGHTLNRMWPQMSEETRKDCVLAVTDIYVKLSTHTGPSASGVDGGHLPEFYLLSNDKDLKFAPEDLVLNCRSIGMNLGSLHLSHGDLGPGNILLDLDETGRIAEGSLGIIDWERAGYVSKEWIRTNFRLDSSLDLKFDSDNWGEIDRSE